MFVLLLNFLKTRYEEYRDRRALRDLLLRDDSVLRDLGLTRPDLESALGKPLDIPARTEAYRLSRISHLLDRLC